MNCVEAREIIHAYVDQELDLVKTLDMERHISGCSDCAAAHRIMLALRSSIRDGSLYFRAPAALERRIRGSVIQKTVTRGMRLRNWAPAAAAAAIVLIATLAWLATRGGGQSAQRVLAAEVASAHVRSLMAEHLWDIKSTDQHTVKPWFEGKVDFAPDVRDFKGESFPLEGGRLDYLAGRPVVALVYRHDKHYINLFIWPAAGPWEQEEEAMSHQGYAIVHWVHSGMNYWAVSDTADQTLRQFASVVRGGGHAATKAAG